MKDQITVGRIVRLKPNKSISGTPTNGKPSTTIPLSTETHFEILGIEGDNIRVRGLGKEAPLGEHIRPITDFELVDEA